jgi:hypothetical protein
MGIRASWLCCTNLDAKGDLLHFNDVVAATLSLRRLPTRVSPKTIESLYRSEDINFAIEVNARFSVEHWLKYNWGLDRDEADLRRRMVRDPGFAASSGWM